MSAGDGDKLPLSQFVHNQSCPEINFTSEMHEKVYCWTCWESLQSTRRFLPLPNLGAKVREEKEGGTNGWGEWEGGGENRTEEEANIMQFGII